MTFAIRVLVIAALAALLPSSADARWTRLNTTNFVFIGDASAGQIREVAEKLERFRDTLMRALPGVTSTSPVPTIVVVFATDRAMDPVKPLFRGNTTEVGGYLQTGEDVNYIALNGEHIDFALPTVFHEYAHLLVGNTLGAVPAWLNEGLAEFYEMTQSLDGDKSVIIGRAPAHHVALLKGSTLIPIKELFAVDHRSQVYNEGSRRGVFYAQSWALTHYLSLGNTERSAQFRRYLSALRGGVEHERAFSEAFGDAVATLDRELFEYVRQFLFPAVKFEFNERVVAAAARATTISDVEGDIHIGEMQARVGRTDEAQRRLKAIVGRQPDAARAWTALGLIEARERRIKEAIPLLERGAERGQDNAFVLTALGRTLITAYNELNSTDDQTALLQRARAPLAKAVDLDPNSAFASGMLGYIELALGSDLPKAVSLLEQATRLAPSRDQYRLMLAQALYRQREFERATNHLGTLLATGRSADIREGARQLLGNIAVARARAAAPSGGALATTPPASERLTPFSAGTDAGTTPARSIYRLDLRAVQRGESRALGQFSAIECSRDLIVLRIDGNGRVWRFATKQLGDVDFITYRTDTAGSVNCGPVKPPVRALVTYRPRTDATTATGAIDGDAVAIELVPDDFQPNLLN